MARWSSSIASVLSAAQPQRSPHRPMRGGIAIVDHEALRRSVERELDLAVAVASPEGVLKMRER